MAAHPPPVPPEQQPRHGGTIAERRDGAKPGDADQGSATRRTEQGSPQLAPDATSQNTTHKGYQQDR